MNYKNNVLAIIPARGGSKGIPKKNIVKIAGKPLIYWTITEAKKSRYVNDIVVSSDSQEIIRMARRYGALAPFVRPKALASDACPTIPVLIHAVRFMEKIRKTYYSHIVLLEPTSPLRRVQDIDGAIKQALRLKNTSVISMYRLKDYHPVRTKKIINDKIKPFYLPEKEGLPRQFLPPAYYRNGAIYVTPRDTLMKNHSIWGQQPQAYLMPAERSIDIDDQISLLITEHLLKQQHR